MLLLQEKIRPLVLREAHEQLYAFLVLKDVLDRKLVTKVESHQRQN